jgi:putative zinc ribbon protein
MEDKTITCADCGQSFSFSAGEQEFYQQRGMSEPKRCKPCRQARKDQRGNKSPGGQRGGRGGGGDRGGSYGSWD